MRRQRRQKDELKETLSPLHVASSKEKKKRAEMNNNKKINELSTILKKLTHTGNQEINSPPPIIWVVVNPLDLSGGFFV